MEVRVGGPRRECIQKKCLNMLCLKYNSIWEALPGILTAVKYGEGNGRREGATVAARFA
jgi:hypothetical protein